MSFVVDKLDSIIAMLSPSWSARREESRRSHAIKMQAFNHLESRMHHAWEAADRDRVRGDSWMTSKLSTNTELEQDLETSWERAEDLYRNDCYAAAAVNARVDNVVGRGVRFQARVKPFGDVISESDSLALNQEIDESIFRWGVADKLRSKQREFARCAAIYGEGLGVWSDISRTDRTTIPLTWNVISPKRLETPPKYSSDPLVRLGIRFEDESYTSPSVYYIRRVESGDSRLFSQEYDAVPAYRVQHSYERMFPGQVRGVPWLEPAINQLKDLKDFKEARLIAEQVACCTTAFVKSGDPIGQALGASAGVDGGGRRIQEMRPAAVEYIGLNDDVVFTDPNRPGSTMEPFMSWYLRGIAAALRIPYELLCKHFDSSFAGGRLALSDGKITFQLWQQSVIDDALSPLYLRAIQELVALGLVNISASAFRAWGDRYTKHAWIPPGWPYAVNPQQEAKADVTLIDAGLLTQTKALSDRGEDFDETAETRKRERIRKMECDAEIERRRKELAVELGDPEFGSGESEIVHNAKEPEQSANG